MSTVFETLNFDSVLRRLQSSMMLGLTFGVTLSTLAAGCNDPSEDCTAGQAGCECVAGLCAAGLACLDGVCVGGGNDGTGDGDGDDDPTGDGDGDPTGDGDGDGDEIPGENCPGETLAASGSLGLDLDVARISGQVTLNGAAMPDWGGTRGSIVFTELVEGTTASYSFGSSGPATYALAVPEGTYQVAWVGNSSTCDDMPAPPFPCNRGILAESLELTQDAALDFDISGVTIVGGVTLNGKVLPDDIGNRGQIGFYSEDNLLALSASFGSTGPGSYSVTLFPGTYDIRWVGNTSLCTNSQASKAPCNTGLLMSGVTLDQSGNLNLDVKAVTVSGQARLAGNVMPDQLGSRGTLVFANEWSAVNTASFGSTGAATYAITLVADTYDIRWNGNESLCDSPADVPCNEGTVLSDLTLTDSGALDVNVPVVKISGAVTVNGATMPNQDSSRGSLSFTNSEGFTMVTKSFGSTGPGNYSVALLPDTYTIGLVGNTSLCNQPLSVDVPCMSGKLLDAVGLTQNGALNVDIPAIQLSGAVTVGGQPLQDWTTNRGGLSFTQVTNDPDELAGVAYSNTFSSTGPGVYTVTLIPGDYDIGWNVTTSACAEGSAPVPCVAAPIIEGVTLQNSGNYDVDADLILLSGPVTLEGAVLPDENSNRGSISFRHVNGGTQTLPNLGSSGPGNYQISLVPGDYVVSHVANSSLCGSGNVTPQVPCASQVVLGCD